MTDAVLGVDSSTQSTKVEVRDLATGVVLGEARAAHPDMGDHNEQDPAIWWDALTAAANRLDPGVRSRVRSMSVAAQQHGLVLSDSEGDALRPAMLWNDTRSAPQADQMVQRLGESAWVQAIGSVPVASFTITKLAWIAEHEPELLDRVASIGLPHDDLTRRLTGCHATDRGDASGTGWFDSVTDSYRIDLLDEVVPGLDWASVLPAVCGHDEAIARISPEAASALGLAPDVLVGAGTGDNMSAAVGVGLGPGDIVISVGTSGTVYCRSATPPVEPNPAICGFAAATGGFLPLVCTLNATQVTDTVRGWLGVSDLSDFTALALSDRAADGPVVVPWFEGERTPNLPTAAGSIHGLTHGVGPAALARAAHDGVLCNLLEGLDQIRAAGYVADGEIRIVGGGSRGAYAQRLADLVGHPITVPSSAEAVATGAAVLAAGMLTGDSCDGITRHWKLGSGPTIEPVETDRDALRTRYRAIAADQSERFRSSLRSPSR